MKIELKNKNVLITGAAGLLGKAIALTCSNAGATLYLHASHWDESRTMWAAKHLQFPYQLLEGDLSRPEERERLISSIPPVDILINNAGVQDLAAITEITPEHMSRFSEINVHAPIQLTSLIAGQQEKSGRAIINILSIEAENPAVSHAMYDTSKGALLQFTRSAALELGEKGIRVNGVSPGVIWREGIEEAWPDGVNRFTTSSPLGKLITAEEVAHTVLFLASDQASAITGINVRVDAGIGVTTGY